MTTRARNGEPGPEESAEAVSAPWRARLRVLGRHPLLERGRALGAGVFEGLVDLALGARCAACRSPSLASRSGPLCKACHDGLPWLADDLCQLCQDRHPLWPDRRCAPCLAVDDPLEACLAAAAFEGEVTRWLHRFKYPGPGMAGLDPGANAVVVRLVREAAAQVGPGPFAVAPIPLHANRLRRRGFNPAALLAREVARSTGGRFAPDLLVRTRDTPSQTGLGRAERLRNVAGVFRVRGAAPARILVVDDVVTTGSTLREAAHALQSGGASEVHAVCAARTFLQHEDAASTSRQSL